TGAACDVPVRLRRHAGRYRRPNSLLPNFRSVRIAQSLSRISDGRRLNSARNWVTQGRVMEKSSKRGKIPQSDWPLIMARYEAGETLSSIARTYDCSPPAISYVVSRSRARQPGGETPRPTPTGETQLNKAATGHG